MSDQALQRRIWRIKNINKLHSFIKVRRGSIVLGHRLLQCWQYAFSL